MTATVSDQFQVSLPPEICAQLGIIPGAKLDFRAHDGKLEAVMIGDIYTAERIAEEAVIQKGCSTKVPGDFPQ